MFLITSILVLIICAFIYNSFNFADKTASFIDGFIFISVSGLVLLHVLPELYHGEVLVPLIILTLGFIGPSLLEKLLHSRSKSIHRATIILGILGLIVHALLDGTVFSSFTYDGHDSHAEVLPLAVVLHRIPVALTICYLLNPVYGVKASWAAIIVMSLATVAGSLFAENLVAFSSYELIHSLQLFVAGSLMHVIFFRFHLDSSGEHCCHHDHSLDLGAKGFDSLKIFKKLPESLGNILGFVLLLVVIFGASEYPFEFKSNGFVSRFFDLLIETSPALLIAYFLGGLLQALISQSSIKWLSKGGVFYQSIKGVIGGLPLPVCSCGIIPLYESLIKKGLAPAAALAFLIATPELGLDAVLISFPLLGLKMTLIRLVAAFFLALIVAVLLANKLQKNANLEVLEVSDKPLLVKIRDGLWYGFTDLVDHSAPWILVGIAIAAFLEPVLSNDFLNLPMFLEILLFALIGAGVYVCASGATPIVAVLIAGGVSPGAALAFLLTGPATNVSTYGMLSKLHNKKFSLSFMSLVAFMAIILGLLTNLIFGNVAVPLSTNSHEHVASMLEIAFCSLLISIYIFSFIRQGGRGFLSSLGN